MRYPVAIIEQGVLNKVHSVWVDTNSIYEAEGKAYAIGRKLFPGARLFVAVIDPSLPSVEVDTATISKK